MEVYYQRLLRIERLGPNEPAVNAVIQKDVFGWESPRCRVEVYVTVRIETALFVDYHLVEYKTRLPAMQGVTDEGYASIPFRCILTIAWFGVL
jgi:hypothetical protein